MRVPSTVHVWPMNQSDTTWYVHRPSDVVRKLVKLQHGRATVSPFTGESDTSPSPRPTEQRDARSPRRPTVTTLPAATSATPVVLPVSKAIAWLAGAVFIALALYYFIGIDEGATSVFGNSMVIHEFMHDSRH